MSGAESNREAPASTPLAPSASDREAVMSALGDAYAADQLELDELERRMARVYRATSHNALADVLAGLGRANVAVPASRRAPLRDSEQPRSVHADERAYEFGMATIARPESVAERAVIMAVMGGAERKGAWVVPRTLKVLAVMGGVELDLREAQFGEGVTEIEVFALMGGIDITVPTGLRVETTGMGVMGGFSVNGADADPGPHAPLLRINGVAIMGGVDAKLKKFKKRGGRAP